MKPKFFPVEVGTKIRMVATAGMKNSLIGQLRVVTDLTSRQYVSKILGDDGNARWSSCWHDYPRKSEYSETPNGYRIDFPFPEEYEYVREPVRESLCEPVRALIEARLAALEANAYAEDDRIRSELRALFPEHVDHMGFDADWNVVQRRKIPNFMQYEIVK